MLGCRVDPLGREAAIERIVALARSAGPALVVTLGTEMVMRARRDPRFRATLDGAALSLCDTIGVALAARRRGEPLPERVNGVELLGPLCRRLAQEASPVYLVGGRGETAARAAEALRAQAPGLIVAGVRDGFFPGRDDAAVARAIAQSGARVALVALGSPRQEQFIAEALGPAGIPVGIGLGGSFDVLAGNVPRAPALVRRLGLEWLFRLLREPWRWRRQLALPQFALLALRERLSDRR